MMGAVCGAGELLLEPEPLTYLLISTLNRYLDWSVEAGLHGGCRYLVFRSFNDMISTVYTKCEGAAGTFSIGNRISTVNSKTKKTRCCKK